MVIVFSKTAYKQPLTWNNHLISHHSRKDYVLPFLRPVVHPQKTGQRPSKVAEKPFTVSVKIVRKWEKDFNIELIFETNDSTHIYQNFGVHTFHFASSNLHLANWISWHSQFFASGKKFISTPDKHSFYNDLTW